MTYTLNFTLPAYESLHNIDGSLADSLTACDASPIPLTDLHMIELHGRQRWVNTDSVFVSYSVAGLEGQPHQLTFTTPDGWEGSVYLQTIDFAGNRSCDSNWITIGIPPVSVPPPIPQNCKVTFYDIQGRKIKPPLASGIYWTRTACPNYNELRRIVIVR